MAGADGTIIVSSVMQDAGFISTVNRFIGSLSSFGAKLTKTQALLGVLGAGIGVVLVKNMLTARREMREFEVQTAELSKVLNDPNIGKGIANVIARLSTELPVARNELMSVAAQAARLGIRGSKNIEEFVRVSAMIGTATDLSADQAADAFARILRQTNSTVRDYERLAGVMNSLANQMATTDAEIVEATRRAAPSLEQFGLTPDEILALSATLNEVSESASRAGTRLRMFAQNLVDPNKLIVFAEALEMDVNAFRELAQQDPRGTIMRIVEAFAAGGEAADIMASKLDSRVRGVLSALAANIENLGRAFSIADLEGTAAVSSIEQEFRIFANTLDSVDIQLENMRKELRRGTVGSFVQNVSRGWAQLEFIVLRVLEGKKELEDLSGNIAATEVYKQSVEEVRDAWVEARLAQIQLEGGPAGSMLNRPGAVRRQAKIAADRVIEIIREEMENAADPDAILEFGTLINRSILAGMTPEEIRQNEGAIRMLVTRYSFLMDEIESSSARGTAEFDAMAASLKNLITQMALSGFTMSELDGEIRIATTQARNYVEKMDPLKQGSEGWSSAASDLIDNLEAQIVEMTEGELAAAELSDAYESGNEAQRKTILDTLRRVIALRNEREATEEANKALQEYTETKFQEGEASVKAASERIANIRTLERETFALEKRREIAAEPREKERAYLELLVQQQNEIDGVRRRIEELAGTERDHEVALLRKQEAMLLDIHHMERGDLIAKLYGDQVDSLAKKMEQFNRTTEEAQLDLLVDIVQDLGRIGGQAFDILIGKTDDLGQAILDMIQDVARAAFQSAISQLLFSALSSLTPTGFQGIDHSVSRRQLPGQFEPVNFDPQFAPMNAQSVAGSLNNGNGFSTVGNGPAQTTVIENHYHYDIRALDGPSVREILVRERDTVAGITMNTISRSRTMKKSGVM